VSDSIRAWKASCGCSATEHDDATKVTPCPIHSMEQALSIMTEQAVKEVAPTGPQWRYLTDADETGWYWCEDMPDGPPQLLLGYCDMDPSEIGIPVFRDVLRRQWKLWTVAGWVRYAGRVAPCTGRPKGGA